jgi:hypothetical protein
MQCQDPPVSSADKRGTMKTALSLVVLSVAVLTGCARHYNITLTNDHVMSTSSRPKYDKATDSFKFKDPQGRPSSVPAFRIKEIAPQ